MSIIGEGIVKYHTFKQLNSTHILATHTGHVNLFNEQFVNRIHLIYIPGRCGFLTAPKFSDPVRLGNRTYQGVHSTEIRDDYKKGTLPPQKCPN